MSMRGAIVSLLMVPGAALCAEEPLDWEMVNRIREEGLHRSQVLDTLEILTDVIGPRLTGSPALKEANEWTRDKLEEWGLERSRVESWGRFGRGWSFSRAAVHMLEPRATPLSALPLAWTPGTEGAVRGEVRRVTLDDEQDLEEHKGKLGGQILFLDKPRDPVVDGDGAFSRYTSDQLEALEQYPVPGEPRGVQARRRRMERAKFRRKRNSFLAGEGVVATVEISGRDAGIVRVGSGGSREPGESTGVTGLVLAAEHYNWVSRLLERGVKVELEADVAARFHDDDLDAYNTMAEMPGSDLADEVVMVGAHLDSWHAAAGANDNGAGCAVVMEAVRILRVLGAEPRRTIRIVLWSGEEQGLLGSRAYVAEHFATRPEPEKEEDRKTPSRYRTPTWPLELKPGHSKLAAYFNVDNGSGRIRGIYTQGNAAVVPIFERWLEPFNDLGADTVTNRDTGGTDHLPFDDVGLPAFQFVQDRLDYSSRTHHTHLDHFDHAVGKDLKQASVILASFLYHAAMRDERLPREPLPRAPARRSSGPLTDADASPAVDGKGDAGDEAGFFGDQEESGVGDVPGGAHLAP